MDKFSKYNPKATLLYFVCIITATLVLFNPIYLAISLVASFIYKLIIDGKRAILYFARLVLPLILIVAAFNMLFVHKGVTVFFTAFDMDFTFEALFYGLCQGASLAAVIMWLSCYNSVVTADGITAVFGRLSPNISLVFTMTLTFIPRLKRNLYEINDARALIDKDSSKLKKSISSFSALVTMTLEEGIETARSMKSRGFNSKRSSYTKYSFSFKDGFVITTELLMLTVLAVIKASGKALFIYEPVIMMDEISIIGIISFAALAFLPIAVNAVENIKWQLSRRKI